MRVNGFKDTTGLPYSPSDTSCVSQHISPISHAFPAPRWPQAPTELDQFEEPLIDLSLPPSAPKIAVSGVCLTSSQMKPLIPSPSTNEGTLWDMALDPSLLDRDDLEHPHPVFRKQTTKPMTQQMLRAPSQSRPRASGPFPENSGHSVLTPYSMPDLQKEESEKLGDEFETEEADEWCCVNSMSCRAERYFCSPCATTFCNQCWDQQLAHKKVRAQIHGGIPHEKTNPVVAKRIEKTLESNPNDYEQAMLHRQDEDTFWFGAGKDEQGSMVFQDSGRYANLMAEKSSLRYPALVSFVGQTGAGKSTLIKLLIELFSSSGQRLQVPVVGSVNHTDTPTSGDVHLYCDPESADGEHSVLYADCEGLDGGEREPIGAISRNRKCTSEMEHKKKRSTSFAKQVRQEQNKSERAILWATTETTCSREYQVRNLYPRLLYTFSDVIVFVMRNPRVIENVIEQLISWAAAALEASSNQPVLPHAIIVLNASENATDPGMWDVDTSTIALMESVRLALHQNHSLRKYAEFWRQRKGSIETVMELLLSYYSSVRVVRVPERGRPKLINQQLRSPEPVANREQASTRLGCC